MKKYFLHDGSRQAGPFDVEELKAKNLNRDTPIWYEGLAEWTTIGNVEELKDIITAIPPPFAAKPVSPPPVQKTGAQNRITLEKSKQGSSLGRRLLTFAGIIVLVLIGIFIYNQIQHEEERSQKQRVVNMEEATKERIRNNITSYVTAERSEYNSNSLGGIYNLKIIITNNTDYVIDNVKVQITYLKATGDVWDTKIVDFNMLAPQTKVTQRIEDTERGTSIDYEIISIKSTALGLN